MSASAAHGFPFAAHEPDYRVVVAAARNRKPAWLPFYEHNVSPVPAQALVGGDWAGLVDSGREADLDEFFRRFAAFFRAAGYDTVSYEYCISAILPGGGALLGSTHQAAIRDAEDFRRYPWDELAGLFWAKAGPRFAALARNLPPGMKAVGGVGNGVFELVQDLAGFQNLAYMQVDEPELFAALFRKVGDLMEGIWREFLRRHAKDWCVCRFGDDLGFKTGCLLQPDVIRAHVIPQYRRVIDQVHATGNPFLLHSCGCIFDVMEDLLAAGIDAKHSNEDAICDFTRWIDGYGDRLGLFGGIDMDAVERTAPEEAYRVTKALARDLRRRARGFAFGTGNQIGHKTPPANYAAMLRALSEARAEEGGA